MSERKFTFIVEFRGGTYCSQVRAKDVFASVPEWIERLRIEQPEIQYLGNKTIEELKAKIENEDNKPVPLTGLVNAWCAYYSTRQGGFQVNIVQTDLS